VDDKPKNRIVPTKNSYSKAKITPVYSNEPAPVVTELKAKVDVPAVSSQIEAVNEGNQ
jgi:hypothetical protein